MFLKTLLSRFESEPLRMTVLVIVAIVVARLTWEFGTGFVDGFTTGLAD